MIGLGIKFDSCDIIFSSFYSFYIMTSSFDMFLAVLMMLLILT